MCFWSCDRDKKSQLIILRLSLEFDKNGTSQTLTFWGNQFLERGRPYHVSFVERTTLLYTSFFCLSVCVYMCIHFSRLLISQRVLWKWQYRGSCAEYWSNNKTISDSSAPACFISFLQTVVNSSSWHVRSPKRKENIPRQLSQLSLNTLNFNEPIYKVYHILC